MPISLRQLLTALLPFAAIGSTAAVDGGYFPTAWGWSALGLLLAAAATVLLADSVDLGRLDVTWLAALAAIVAWIALSAVWSESVTRTVLEAERGLVYVAAVAALLLLAIRGGSAALLAGVLAASASVCAYALATRLFPDRFGYEPEAGYQLARPLGYWNALGLLAAIGLLVAVGFAAALRGRPARMVAAASVPVLATTLYFTFSRGATLALAAGLLVTVALESHRLRLVLTGLAVALPAAVAIVLGARSEGLARERAALETATREGHRLALALVLLTAASTLVPLALDRLRARIDPAPSTRRIASRGLLVLCLLGVVAALAEAGGPVAVVERTWDSFSAPLPQTGGELDRRLLSVSGNGRVDYWRVAGRQYADHPLLGSGAGTYELHWARGRPTAFDARDAHNLYLETLAELGPLGLALLVFALALPVAALRWARRTPFAATAVGGYAALLAHAALDWDWEVPAVMLSGLTCGAALVVAARDPDTSRALSSRDRAAALGALAAAASLAFVGYIGNSALARSSDAAAEGRYDPAAEHARRASRWAPWSSEAWRARGEAALALGDTAEARASFTKAVEKDPRDWNLWYDLALASDGDGRREALARARELNPRAAELGPMVGG